MKLSYDVGVSTFGVLASRENIDGDSMIKGYTAFNKAAFVKLNLADSKELQIGFLGQYEASELGVNLYVPKSVGDGNLTYAKESLSSTQDNVSAALYMNAGSFRANLYSDKFDKAAYVGYNTQF